MSTKQSSTHDKIDLATVLPSNQRNLGTIIITNGISTPTVAQIKTKLTKKSIDTSQVEITNITNKSATIKPTSNSTKYKDNPVIISYQINLKTRSINLKDIIKNTYLGDSNIFRRSSNNDPKIKEWILYRLKIMKLLDINKIEIELLDDFWNNKARIKSIDENYYIGFVDINWSFYLKSVIFHKNLRIIETNGKDISIEEAIKNQIKKIKSMNRYNKN